jgi:hypothetical protein
VFRIPLGVYRLSLARWFCRRIPRALAAIEVTELVAIRSLSTFWSRALRSPGSQACDDGHAQVAARSF